MSAFPSSDFLIAFAVESRPRVSQLVGCSTGRQPGNPIDQHGIVWRNAAGVKITPLDLSIAKALGRIFEVKYPQYIAFEIVPVKCMLRVGSPLQFPCDIMDEWRMSGEDKTNIGGAAGRSRGVAFNGRPSARASVSPRGKVCRTRRSDISRTTKAYEVVTPHAALCGSGSI